MWGGDFGSLLREHAGDYTAESAAEYEANLSKTYAAINEANSLNSQLREGTITANEAKDKIKNNPMLQAVSRPNPLTDPPFLKSENKLGGCSIRVGFTGNFDESHPNGPGPFKYFGVPTHGLGFTATVSVASGGVGRIGLDVNMSNPSGAWSINQMARLTSVENGKQNRPHNAPYDVGNYSFTGGATFEQNPIAGASTYTWHDHPGYAVEGVNSFSGNYTFLIEAKNRKTGAACVVGFRMELTFSQQKGWTAHWGR
jgi:hypothetical protein